MNLDNEPTDRLLGLIKRRGPQRTGDLAAGLAITAEAARQQLARLEVAGLVAPQSVAPTGRGRPSRLWHLTAAGHGRFPDTHAELTVCLISAVREAFGETGLDRLIALREAATEATYRAALDGATDLADRLDRLAALRAREGYMAEWRPDGDGFLLLENHCPICAAATACQGFCRAELMLFQALLGPDGAVERIEHLLAGARRCAYRIIPTNKEISDGLDRRRA